MLAGNNMGNVGFVEIYASHNKIIDEKSLNKKYPKEEAKAALLSRIQRLTKLILVSTKNTIPGLDEIPSHQRYHSVGEDDII
ncbi:hypothetical protein RHSIM_Rhsim09G0020900 [Rhododendron simsii]|uniref:Uncharacterized protein n=1 Tax=Rhododendron simsii TaxID=118357 RepID=A0A834LBR6_RHOSS|nr:hypothetical protein RHSIM_Rhsim09G0020900 [Rhododendron simsii]